MEEMRHLMRSLKGSMHLSVEGPHVLEPAGSLAAGASPSGHVSVADSMRVSVADSMHTCGRGMHVGALGVCACVLCVCLRAPIRLLACAQVKLQCY